MFLTKTPYKFSNVNTFEKDVIISIAHDTDRILKLLIFLDVFATACIIVCEKMVIESDYVRD